MKNHTSNLWHYSTYKKKNNKKKITRKRHDKFSRNRFLKLIKDKFYNKHFLYE